MTKIFNIAEVTPEEMLEPVDTLNTIIEQLNDADIPDGPGGESYTLPVATSTTLGGIKAGEGLTVAADGTASVDVPEPAEPLSFSGGLAESDGTVTAVLGAGLSLVNGAITALGGGEGGGGGDYVLPVATADALGGVKVATSGPITIGLDGTLGLADNIIPTASDTILGGIKVGDGLTIDDSGVLSVDDAEGSEYVLPVASADELGGVKVASSGPITIGEDGTLGVSDDIIPTASTTVLGGVKAPVNNFPAAGTPASLEISEDGTINAHIATDHTAGVLKIADQGMDIYATAYNPIFMDKDQNQCQEISPFFVESDTPWDGEGSGGRLAMVTTSSFNRESITYTDSRTSESVTRTALGLTPASIAVLGGVKVTNDGGLMMNDGVLSANLDPDTMILKNGKISAVGGGGGLSEVSSKSPFYVFLNVDPSNYNTLENDVPRASGISTNILTPHGQIKLQPVVVKSANAASSMYITAEIYGTVTTYGSLDKIYVEIMGVDQYVGGNGGLRLPVWSGIGLQATVNGVVGTPEWVYNGERGYIVYKDGLTVSPTMATFRNASFTDSAVFMYNDSTNISIISSSAFVPTHFAADSFYFNFS